MYIPAAAVLVIELILPFLAPPVPLVAVDLVLLLPDLPLLLLSTRARNDDVLPLGLRVATAVVLLVSLALLLLVSSLAVVLLTLLLLPLLPVVVLTLAIGAAVVAVDVVAFTASSICNLQCKIHNTHIKIEYQMNEQQPVYIVRRLCEIHYITFNIIMSILYCTVYVIHLFECSSVSVLDLL
jgi:hypothetical protein